MKHLFWLVFTVLLYSEAFPQKHISTFSGDIIALRIELNTRYSWGYGSQKEVLRYHRKKNRLVARRWRRRYYPGANKGNQRGYVHLANPTMSINALLLLIDDVQSAGSVVTLTTRDGLQTINLKNKLSYRSSTVFPCGVEDGTYYQLNCWVFSQQDTFRINYSFDDCLSNGPIYDVTPNHIPVEWVLKWLHCYELVQLVVKKHTVLDYFFRKENLSRVEEWAYH